MRKALIFVGSSLKELRAMPEDVKDVFGSALLDAQYGDRVPGARSFGEGLPAEVVKLVEDHDRDTYRVAFTVAFPRCVYVLHVFKKKSKKGIATPSPILKTIRHRLHIATTDYKERYGRS